MKNQLLTYGAFVTYNLLYGNSIKNYYKEFKKQLKTPNNDEAQKILKAYLEKWGFNKVIENNPIQSKKDILSYVQQVKNKDIKTWAYTGGSYGEPLRVPFSRNRADLRTASILFYNKQAGYKIGMPYLLIRAKDKSILLKKIRNEYIFVPKEVSDAKIEGLIRLIFKKRIELIIGYPSVIQELANFLNENKDYRIQNTVKHIITVAEPFSIERKKFVSETFNSSLVDRYANEENGLIAQQTSFDSPYLVNQTSLYVEVINPETLLPVNEGEVGKVVVTDLYNEFVPFVRYDTGDLAKVAEYKNGKLFSISNILGRITEQIFNQSGTPISPLSLGPIIYKPLSKSDKVVQYQFAQTGKKDYELRLKANENQIASVNLEKIRTELQHSIGEGSQIKIVFLTEIPALPSGKKPVFKNEINF